MQNIWALVVYFPFNCSLLLVSCRSVPRMKVLCSLRCWSHSWRRSVQERMKLLTDHIKHIKERLLPGLLSVTMITECCRGHLVLPWSLGVTMVTQFTLPCLQTVHQGRLHLTYIQVDYQYLHTVYCVVGFNIMSVPWGIMNLCTLHTLQGKKF